MNFRAGNKSSERIQCAAALLIYLALALIFFARGLLGDFTGGIVSASTGHDPSVMIWCLVWWPHAIANHLNPFLSRAVWWPSGINLAWITSMPGAAILAWPLTRTLGPIASFNLLCIGALPAAAFAQFLLCRHLTRDYWASLVGGYVFGFSPYFLGHLQAHLLLILAFPIPLAVLLMIRLLERDISPRSFVPLMAALIALQIGFSLEMFATMTVIGIAAMALAFAIGTEDWRSAIRPTAMPLAGSYAIAAVVAAPYWFYLFAFTMPKGSIISPAGVSSDLVNFLIPTEANLFGANSLFREFAAQYTFRSEAGAWVPWPLLTIVAFYIWSRWHTNLGKVLVVMLAAIWLATLGPRLHFAGHTMFGLPWKIVEHLPLMKSALPARLTIYGFLIIALMTATAMASREISRPMKYGAAIAIAIFMLPNLRASFWVAPLDLPQFFANGTYRKYLAKDESIVTLPYGNRGSCMLWQAYSEMYFRMAGGYTGPEIVDAFLEWPAVSALYWGSEIPDGRLQLGAFLAAHDTRDIIVEQSHAQDYAPILSILDEMKATPIEAGGVLLYRIPADQITQYRGANPIDLEQRYDRYRFARLVVAADQYLSSGGDPSQLTPSIAMKAGLLPSSWAVDRDVYTKDGLILGPWKSNQTLVGVVGSYDALRPLIDAYRPDAAAVYFPFPHVLDGPPKGSTFMRKLALIFDREGLARAAKKAAEEIGRAHSDE